MNFGECGVDSMLSELVCFGDLFSALIFTVKLHDELIRKSLLVTGFSVFGIVNTSLLICHYMILT